MSIKRQMAKGASWTVLIRLMNRSLGFISTMILARLLAPADFGLVAMAMVFVALCELIGTSIFDTFLIQKENLSDQDLNTAWTLQVLAAVFQALILAAASIPIAHFYGAPRLIPVILAFSAALFILGFRNIGAMYFQRDMRFHYEFLLIGGRKLAAALVTVTLAYLLRNYWALVAGTLTGRLTAVILSYVLHPYRPRFQLAGWREMLGFSKWLYINNFLYFLGQRGPELIIGKICGAGPVGLFSVSYDIAMLPTTEMVAPINRAVFPGYARMSRNLAQLRDGYLSVLGMIALAAVPAGVGIAATSGVLVPLLLGHKWANAVPLIQTLAIVGALGSLQTNAGSIYLGQGKPWILTYVTLLRNCMLLPTLVFLTVTSGVRGAAIAYLGTALLMCPAGFTVLMKMLKPDFKKLLAQLYRPILAAGAMYGGVHSLLPLLQSMNTLTTSLVTALAILAGAGIYIVSIILIWALSGRPAGAEAILLGLAHVRIAGYFATEKQNLCPPIDDCRKS